MHTTRLTRRLCAGALLSLHVAGAHAVSLFWPGYAGWRPPPPPQPAAPAPLMVVDADGKTLGRFQTGLGGEVFAYTETDGEMTAIWLATGYRNAAGLVTDYLGPANQPLNYTTADCTGVPYLHEGYGRGLGALRTATVKTSSGWLLYVAASLESQSAPLKSYRDDQGICRQILAPLPAYTAFPSRAPVEFAFTPPFRVR